MTCDFKNLKKGWRTLDWTKSMNKKRKRIKITIGSFLASALCVLLNDLGTAQKTEISQN
jgi:hypothetical protein